MDLTEQDREFLTDFRTLSAFGATPGGGVERQAGTAADIAQRHWFEQWLQDRGLRVQYDEIGNQYGLLQLRESAPWVLTGSHLDSQPLAGRFDGAYGVLASAHAADRLRRQWASTGTTPAYNIAVVNWFNEEGSRFKPSMMGSAVFTGKLSLDQALSTADPTGMTVEAVLSLEDMLGSRPFDLPASYVEIHIEQGRSLERRGRTIGLVEGTWAAHKLELVVTGDQSHTGATPMADRRDALFGAAMIIVKARELAERHANLHTAVSELYVTPNSPVTIAREVKLHVDLRSEAGATVEQAVKELFAHIEDVASRARVQVRNAASHVWDRRDYAPAGVELAQSCAEELGMSTSRLLTLAGHDSTNMNEVVPTVMLFVPSHDGVTHNEAEDTDDADAVKGVCVLTKVVGRLATTGIPSLPATTRPSM